MGCAQLPDVTSLSFYPSVSRMSANSFRMPMTMRSLPLTFSLRSEGIAPLSWCHASARVRCQVTHASKMHMQIDGVAWLKLWPVWLLQKT